MDRIEAEEFEGKCGAVLGELEHDCSEGEAIAGFICDVVGKADTLDKVKKLQDALEKISGNKRLLDIHAEVWGMVSRLIMVSFGIGYGMGQMVDMAYGEDVEEIQRVIREEGLLLYTPREPRGKRTKSVSRQTGRCIPEVIPEERLLPCE